MIPTKSINSSWLMQVNKRPSCRTTRVENTSLAAFLKAMRHLKCKKGSAVQSINMMDRAHLTANLARPSSDIYRSWQRQHDNGPAGSFVVSLAPCVYCKAQGDRYLPNTLLTAKKESFDLLKKKKKQKRETTVETS